MDLVRAKLTSVLRSSADAGAPAASASAASIDSSGSDTFKLPDDVYQKLFNSLSI